MEKLWDRICDKETLSDWAPGKALEYLMMRGFELSGAEITYPYEVMVHDKLSEQIDGVVYHNGIAAIFECKDYVETNKINFEPIAKLNAYLQRRTNSTIGCVVSMSGFTKPALILADYLSNRTILLWQKEEIKYALDKRNFGLCLKAKFRNHVEHGVYNFNVITI